MNEILKQVTLRARRYKTIHTKQAMNEPEEEPP
jgi:hypothetical protein